MAKVWLVSAKKDIYDIDNTGVEIAGVFNNADEAYEANHKVQQWLEDKGFEDAEVFVTEMEVGALKWYDVEEI